MRLSIKEERNGGGEMMLNQRLVHLENSATDPVMSNSFGFMDLETELMSLYLLDTRSTTPAPQLLTHYKRWSRPTDSAKVKMPLLRRLERAFSAVSFV